MHYLIQAIFVGVGALTTAAAAFDWDWFFSARNTQFVVGNVGRRRARWFYGLLGILMIAIGVATYLEVSASAPI